MRQSNEAAYNPQPMTEHYGLVCKNPSCKTVFVFDIAEDVGANQIEFPCPPLAPIPCPRCQQAHQYVSDEVLRVALLGRKE